MSTADRAVVSDTGGDGLYGRSRSAVVRRPPSRAASLLERDETTEV